MIQNLSTQLITSYKVNVTTLNLFSSCVKQEITCSNLSSSFPLCRHKKNIKLNLKKKKNLLDIYINNNLFFYVESHQNTNK
jgi:hypothetical protein